MDPLQISVRRASSLFIERYAMQESSRRVGLFTGKLAFVIVR